MKNLIKKLLKKEANPQDVIEEKYLGLTKAISYNAFWNYSQKIDVPVYGLYKNGKLVELYSKKDDKKALRYNIDVFLYENGRFLPL